VSLDHVSEVLIGFQTLPFELRPPVLEELPLPALSSAVVEDLRIGLSSLKSIEVIIAPGQRAPRGKATLEAVFGYLDQRTCDMSGVIHILGQQASRFEDSAHGLHHLSQVFLPDS